MIIQVNDSLLNTLGDVPDVPRVLVGSMKDLSEKRQVSYEVRVVPNPLNMYFLYDHFIDYLPVSMMLL